MNEEQNIVYTEGIILQARIELESMLVANKEREQKGESPAYNEEAFISLRDKHCIYHNGLITNLCGR